LDDNKFIGVGSPLAATIKAAATLLARTPQAVTLRILDLLDAI